VSLHSPRSQLRGIHPARSLFAGDITLEAVDAFPVIVTEVVTISGAGHPNFTGPGELNYTGSVVLDFNDLFPVFEIAANATLELENLQVTGIVPAARHDVKNANLPQAKGLWLWPAIIPSPNSTFVERNVLQQGNAGQADCSEAALTAIVNHLDVILQGPSSGYRLDPPSIWTPGNHTLIFEVTEPPGLAASTSRGFATLKLQGGTGLCFLDPYLYPNVTAATSATHPSGGAIAGIAIGSVLGVVVIAAIIFTGITRWRRKAARPSLPLQRPALAALDLDSKRSAVLTMFRVDDWVTRTASTVTEMTTSTSGGESLLKGGSEAAVQC
jgi:hypothetical protein